MTQKKKKPIVVLRVKITGEIYDRVYGIKDFQNVIDLFNDIHAPKMVIKLEEVENVGGSKNDK